MKLAIQRQKKIECKKSDEPIRQDDTVKKKTEKRNKIKNICKPVRF